MLIKFKKLRGSSLVEALIAIMILGAVATFIVTITLQVLAANNSAKMKNQAVAYTQQALEQVRGYYQTNGWMALHNMANCYTGGDLSSYSVCTGDGNKIGSSPYSQWVKIELTTPSQVTVTTKVTWLDREQKKTATASAYFFNY